ncbi:hypothetical protein ANN_20098 [Periplaneta americana]|uniref:Uncharacterized protein n=2 Tax=Periplaneta americana TaxID=6978 RepID=A0ABQ8SBW8_PERAM|nr:hypothetical protein ANN_20098 [Periplaneta americana]
MGESRNAHRVLVGRLEGKRPLGRPRRRWEDNIKMDLREVGHDGRDWINLAQDRDQWRAYVRPPLYGISIAVNGGDHVIQSGLNLLWTGFRTGDSPRPSCRRSLSLQRGDSPRNSFKRSSSPRSNMKKNHNEQGKTFPQGSIELENAPHEKTDSQEETGTQTETELEDNKESELQKSLSFGDKDADAKSHSLGADSTPPSLLLSGFSSPKKLSSLLDSQIAASRSELIRLEETKKLQSECENLKGQLSALSEKYNALAMRHIQYKTKRKAQVEDLRNRLDVELSSLQCQVENLQSQLTVQRKMLTTEENFRERIEADYRKLQEEKRTLMVNVMQLETTMREKDRELSILGKKITLLENANSDLLAKVLQLKYASGRHHLKGIGAVTKSNSIEGVLTDLGRV